MTQYVSHGIAFPGVPLDRVVLLLGGKSRAVQAAVDESNQRLRARRATQLLDQLTLAHAGMLPAVPEPGIGAADSVWGAVCARTDQDQLCSRASMVKATDVDCDVELLSRVITREREALIEVSQALVPAHALLVQIPGAVNFSCPRGPAAGETAEEVLKRASRWQQAREPAATFNFRMAWTPGAVEPGSVLPYLPETSARVEAWALSRVLERLVREAREQGSRRPLGTLERELGAQLREPTELQARAMQLERDVLSSLLTPTELIFERMTAPLDDLFPRQPIAAQAELVVPA